MGVCLLAEGVAANPLVLQTAVFGLLGVIGVLGLFAVLSPERFAHLANRSSQLVETSHYLRRLDEPVNCDKHVLRYSRIFGVAVMLSAAFLAWVFSHVLH